VLLIVLYIAYKIIIKLKEPTITIIEPKNPIEVTNAGNTDIPVKALNNAMKEKAKATTMTNRYINLVSPFIVILYLTFIYILIA